MAAIGTQIEAPSGLGSLASGIRYYVAQRRESDVLLVWFERTTTTRWRVRNVRVDATVFEKELLESPPGLRIAEDQSSLPLSLAGLEGYNFDRACNHDRIDRTDMAVKVQAREAAITPLLAQEEKIMSAEDPLAFTAMLARSLTLKDHHIYDLQYWFFCFVLHGRNRWALAHATHNNGTWIRGTANHASKKFGRPSCLGQRNGWPAAPMHEQIVRSYLRRSARGKSLRSIYTDSMTEDFGCESVPTPQGGRVLVHPLNKPFPTLGQFRYRLMLELGLKQVQTNKHGRERMRRVAPVDAGNTTGRLRNILEQVQMDGYWTEDAATAYGGAGCIRLVVVRGICATTSARCGIGFSVEGENQLAYSSARWCMASPKSLVAEVYGIAEKFLDWPMIGLGAEELTDRGPGSTISDTAGDTRPAAKGMTGSYAPKSKPVVETSNPRSTELDGAPTKVITDMSVAALMKREVLRAAAENRTTNVSEKLTPEMVLYFDQHQLPATPSNMWRYLDERCRTSARQIHPDEAIRTCLPASLLRLDRQGVVRAGIHFNSTEFRESGTHQRLIASRVKEVKAYFVPLASRVIWIEAYGRLHKLSAELKLKSDGDDFNFSLAGADALEAARRRVKARTRASSTAAAVGLASSVKEETGISPSNSIRVGARSAKSKKNAAEAAALKRAR